MGSRLRLCDPWGAQRSRRDELRRRRPARRHGRRRRHRVMGFVSLCDASRSAPAERCTNLGFSLVEILVVIVILAIGTAIAIVSWNGSDRDRALREARLFAGALEHAAARAQVRAETLGASAEGAAWRF